MANARYLGWLGAVVGLLLISTTALWANTGTVQPTDWQYRELDALSRVGLLNGHPQAPLGEWADSLTRYEAASLVLRAAEGVGKAYQAQGEALLEVAQTAGEEAPAVAPQVTAQDLARLEKLVEEFRAELVTMGARVDDLATTLKGVQQRLSKVEADQKQHRLDGYLQFRYRNDDGADANEFLVRRARFNVRGPVSDRVSYRVEFQMDAKESGKGPGSKVQLRTAYADYQLSNGKLRVGQAKIPWGYELLASVPDLWTAERSLFMDRLFPDQRDIGVQWSYRPSPQAPQFDVGIFNGTGINASDTNDRKNLMARVDFPLPNGTVALSTYLGEKGVDAAATDQDRNGLSAQFKWGEAEFMGEYVDGKDAGHDVRGWYAQLGHPLGKKKPNLLFAKYDKYDENLDLPMDLFRRWSLGYWYEIDKSTRLTLVWESRDAESGFSEYSKWDGDGYYAQMQTKF